MLCPAYDRQGAGEGERWAGSQEIWFLTQLLIIDLGKSTSSCLAFPVRCIVPQFPHLLDEGWFQAGSQVSSGPKVP